MKDYQKVAEKIRKMGGFSEISNCFSPTPHNPVDLYFRISEPYIIGIEFYVSYSFGKWIIDYTIDKPVSRRTDMRSIRGIKTDKEMYFTVEKIINQIRKAHGVKER